MDSFPTQRRFTDQLLVQSSLTYLANIRLCEDFYSNVRNFLPSTREPLLSITRAFRQAFTSPFTLSTRSFLKPLPYLPSVTCVLIAHNLCADQWRLCYLLVGNCPLHQYSVCAGNNVASPGVLLMSLMCD